MNIELVESLCRSLASEQGSDAIRQRIFELRDLAIVALRAKTWVMVPDDPTGKMVEAGRAALEQQDPVRVSHARVLWIWKDMLAVRPKLGGSGALEFSAEEIDRIVQDACDLQSKWPFSSTEVRAAVKHAVVTALSIAKEE